MCTEVEILKRTNVWKTDSCQKTLESLDSRSFETLQFQVQYKYILPKRCPWKRSMRETYIMTAFVIGSKKTFSSKSLHCLRQQRQVERLLCDCHCYAEWQAESCCSAAHTAYGEVCTCTQTHIHPHLNTLKCSTPTSFLLWSMDNTTTAHFQHI